MQDKRRGGKETGRRRRRGAKQKEKKEKDIDLVV